MYFLFQVLTGLKNPPYAHCLLEVGAMVTSHRCFLVLLTPSLSSTRQGFVIVPNYNAFEAVDGMEPPLPAEEREMYRQYGRFCLTLYMVVGFILLTNLLIGIMASRYK